MNPRPKVFVCLFLLSLCFPVNADIVGRVVRVIDGDTLVLLTEEKEQIRVRLSEIDAPERSQAFGSRAKEALIALCANSPAVLKKTSKDRYGRTLARVYCEETDANAEMIKLGMAWVYLRYANDDSLLPLQSAAQLAKQGLWQDTQPIPPWEFRQKSKN